MNSLPYHFKYLEQRFLMDLYSDYGINIKLKRPFQGGGKVQKVKYTDNKIEYVFTLDIEPLDDDTFHIVLVSESKDECVTVYVNPKTKIAILHNLSYYNKCATNGLSPSGTVLLKFIIFYLTKHKSIFNINRIVLKDHSFLYCNGCDETVKLAWVRMVTKGTPWYMSHGFKPFDGRKNKPDDKALISLKANNESLNTMKTNIIDIISIAKSLNKYDMKELQRLIVKYPLFRDFVIRLNNEYDKYCCLIAHILEDVFNRSFPQEVLLYDFFDKTFYMDI